MFFAGCEPDDVARANFLHPAALALHPAETGDDDQGLTQRVCVPGGACAGLEGHLRTLHGGALEPGTHEVVLDLAAPGRQRWTASLVVDGETRASLDDVPMLYGMAPFEGIDVGIDRRSPVSWELYERFGPFPYTGTIRRVRYEPGEPAPDAPERMLDVIREMGAKFE